MRRLLAITLLGTGCTSPVELGTLSESEAMTALVAAQRELQKVHEIALLGPPYPQMYMYGCSSGAIDMRISTDQMMQPVTLRHTFTGCTSEAGITFTGGLNYVDIEPGCDDESGQAFLLGGKIEMTGAMEGFPIEGDGMTRMFETAASVSRDLAGRWAISAGPMMTYFAQSYELPGLTASREYDVGFYGALRRRL